MHDQLHDGAALRSIEVEADSLPLTLGLVHKEALIVIVEDQALSLREAEHGCCLARQLNLLVDVSGLLVYDLVVLFICQVDQLTVPIDLVWQLLQCNQFSSLHLFELHALILIERQRLVLRHQTNLIHHERAFLRGVARCGAHLERVHGIIDTKAVHLAACFYVLDGAQVWARYDIYDVVGQQSNDHTAREEHDLINLGLAALTAIEQLEVGLAATLAILPGAY